MSEDEKSVAIDHSGHVEDTDHSKALAKIDTVHQDEAMKVLATYDGDQTWTDKEEKKLRRKVDWRLMPILCTTYMLQYYDKAMLSQAVSELTIELSKCCETMPANCAMVGSIWPANRPRLDRWPALPYDRLYILSRVHHWSLSCNDACSEVPN